MSRKARHYCLQLENLSSPAALILKEEMLALGGEAAIPAQALTNSEKKCKVIVMGTMAQFLDLAEKLKPQPFRLPRLGQDLVKTIENFERKKFRLETPGGSLELGEKPVLMGIVNLTPDSFYDGGKFFDPGKALDRAETMAQAGAGIIDIGGESTRPGSDAVSLEEELRRVMPVMEKIKMRIGKALVSIDTRKSEVAKKAIEAGASIINDTSSLDFDPNMAEVAAESKAGLVLMHLQGAPKDMQEDPTYEDLFSEVIGFLRSRMQRALNAGVAEERIIVDPGIGFGKTVDHNLELIRDLWRLRSLGRPILLGPSNKRFIGAVLKAEKDDRFEGTAAAAVAGILSGANILRAHEPEKIRRFAIMASAIRAGRNIWA
jgi:dihydropteroate synthase